jgi:hypothetical protein
MRKNYGVAYRVQRPVAVVISWGKYQWEFQDPIYWRYVLVPFLRPYFVGIFPYIGLIYGRYLQ